MRSGAPAKHSPLLFGRNAVEGLVAVEHVEGKGAADEMALFFRDGDRISRQDEPFEPFIVATAEAIAECPVEHEVRRLKGNHRLGMVATFATWKDFLKVRKWLNKKTGYTPSSPEAPYYSPADAVQQHLMAGGRTLFLGMRFEALRRMQVDIECLTSEGYEFCNAGRPGDRIIAIAVGLPNGKVEVLAEPELDEKGIIEKFVTLIAEHDPDVIEGHNVFNFDLPYIAGRARRHKVRLALGRDGSEPARRPSRMAVAERMISYERFDIFGRHVVDTLHLVQAYDVSHRVLDGFGLKEVAVHFGLAPPGRTYIAGSEITSEFRKRPKKVMRYVRDDIIETRELGNLLSRSSFAQAQLLPFSYQNVCVKGNATKIDALMVREYLREGESLPFPDRPREFAGGYTDMFVEGIVENVHHCDVRSLYPSLMLTRKIAPKSDRLGAFLKMLEVLRDYRFEAKQAMLAAKSESERNYHDALQTTFKTLINSFYGYLGFSQGRFSDFDAAEKITGDGRLLLKSMIKWLRDHDAEPVEIDTDGIYFVPPPMRSAKEKKKFRDTFAASLPEGIEIEFDGEYKSMFSYKMKNYAVLTHDGEIVIKGAALKSRGLEPFQRSLLRQIIRLRLEEKEEEIPRLKTRCGDAIRNREWPIRELAKTETLQDAPSTYAAKREKGKGSRRAVYELALASGREYRAGDQLS